MTVAPTLSYDDGGDVIPPLVAGSGIGGEEEPLPATATVARTRRREEKIQQLLRQQQQHSDIGVPSSAFSSPRIITMGNSSTDDDQDNIDEVDNTAIVAGEGGRQLDNDGDDELLFPGGGVLRNSQHLFTRNGSDENEMATLFHSTSAASGTLAGQNLLPGGIGNNNNAGGGGIGTPLLNGENIVLLSYSNETTPSGQLTMSAIADQLYGDGDNNGGVAGIRQRRRSHPQRVITDDVMKSNEIRNNSPDMPQAELLDTEDQEEGDQDMTLSPNSFIGDLESTDVLMASSPPPESVHSGVLTSLSPPPLSIKSAGGGAGGGGGVGPYYAPPSSSGSVGLFSRGEHPPASSVASGGVGSGVGGGGNGGNYAAAPPKENWRPPLPPRWAIPGGGGTQGTAGLASPHHAPPPPQPQQQPQQQQQQQQQTRAVDVVPTHLPPLPKQIGQLHHRRVLSTGDASLLSNLTDPDSIPDLGEENSPTQPPGSTTFATANNTGAGGGGNGGMERAFFPVAPAPSQTTNSLSAKPLTMNPPHRRGVSWAAFGGSEGGGGVGGGGDGDAWLSSSYSLNRFQSEEEATFDTLGILQPILQDGDGDEDISKFLMQPVLGDDNDMAAPQPAMIGGMGSAFESANAAAAGVDTTVPPSPLPPPPPPASPPERVTRILEDESNQPTAKKRERNISQFEYEAEMAILEALNEQQMTSIDARDLPMNNEDASGERIEELAPDIEPDFQSWISPNSEGSLPLDQKHDTSRSLFENSAWTSEYDARGRIDGTLPEERDAKLVEIDMKQLGNDVPSVAVIESHAPSIQEQIKTKESDNSPRSILKSNDGANEINVPNDGAESTGLRHRKVKSIAAKSMADELAALAAMHGGVTKNDAPVLTKDGGIDNLLAGVVSLAQQGEGKHQSQDHPTTTSSNENGGDGNAGEDDAPRDEETGDAKQIIRGDNAGYNFGASKGWSSRSSLGRQGSEKLYYLRGWYHELIKPKLPAFWTGATHFVCFTMLPLLTVAFILYYAAGNPMAGGATVEAIMDATEGLDYYEYASWSWWALFFVRQAFVLAYIRTVEVFTIDILALRTSIFLKTFGSFATLMFAQARGWPYVLTFWSIADFCVLFGNHQFARHWLYWQDSIDLFNASNPAGSFLHSEFYMRALLAMLFVGVSTSLKRLWLATFLGRRSYAHYSSSLEVILAKMLLVSQVSHLARQIEQMIGEPDSYMYSMHPNSFAFPESTFIMKTFSADSEDETSYPSLSSTNRDGFGKSLLDAGFASSQSRLNLNPTNNAKAQPSTSASAKLELKQLVGEWEEPDYKCPKSTASIKDILQFRQAVSMMDDTYPFTPAFGPAKTRVMCVESSERLYDTLMKNTPNEKLLPFETLSRIAYDSKGQLMRDKTKALIKLFRPNRQGFLTKLEFVSSVDEVYRELRLFRASLANSSSIDDVFELIINIIFYIISFFLVLLIVGFEVWEPILSFSAFFFSFSFMFGPASSKYFEGILLIFVRRPYDIGDKIALSDPEVDTSPTGSSTWFVEKVTIFTTTVRFASTNEVATYSNGSLARLRIINAKRSPKAVVCVYVKFGSNSSFDMIKLFQNVVESFIKARPREWAQLNGIQATRVEMELNYIEYVISATHREMWQNIGPIKASQADLASFALEVSKRLNLRYQSPPKPIHLSVCKREKKEQPQQPTID